MSKSRVVWMADVPGLAGNANTAFSATGCSSLLQVSFRDEFLGHYGRFVEQVRAFDKAGVAVVAIDRRNSTLAGVACVASGIEAPKALVIGRHSRSELPLAGDASMSLRHFAVIVEPQYHPQAAVRYRLLDLRSTHGMRTEDGRLVGAIASDGPTLVTSGAYAFLVLPAVKATDWPDDGNVAWSLIPERTFLHEEPRAQGSGVHREPKRALPLKMQPFS